MINPIDFDSVGTLPKEFLEEMSNNKDPDDPNTWYGPTSVTTADVGFLKDDGGED